MIILIILSQLSALKEKMLHVASRDAQAEDCQVQGSHSNPLVDNWEKFPPNEGESGAVRMRIPLTLDPQPAQ